MTDALIANGRAMRVAGVALQHLLKDIKVVAGGTDSPLDVLTRRCALYANYSYPTNTPNANGMLATPRMVDSVTSPAT